MRKLRKIKPQQLFSTRITLSPSKDGMMANYLFFVLNDMAETVNMVSEEQNRLISDDYSPYVKKLVNTLKYVNKDLRKFVAKTSDQSQEEFGDTADSILRILLYFIDRCGDNYAKYSMVLNFIKSINSELNLNLKLFGIHDE